MRAKAHHLNPVVAIGQHGLTPAVLHEIDVALTAHELIKLRVFSDDRVAREALLARVCAELDAAPVQHVGKILIVWRPDPEPAPAAPPIAKPKRAQPRPRTAAGPRSRGAATSLGKRGTDAAPGKRGADAAPGKRGTTAAHGHRGPASAHGNRGPAAAPANRGPGRAGDRAPIPAALARRRRAR